MKTFITTLVLLSLFGCATPYDLKHSKPIVSYSTTRPAEEVMKCIRKKWESHLHPVESKKTSTGWQIRHYDVLPAATVAVVTIDTVESNVEVNYYNHSKLIRMYRVEDEVRDCK